MGEQKFEEEIKHTKLCEKITQKYLGKKLLETNICDNNLEEKFLEILKNI